MLIEVHKEKLKELSARILLENKDGTYSHQGSGILYVDNVNGRYKGYILTAAHVLKEFHSGDDTVVVECYSEEKRPDDVYVVEDHLFRVKRSEVWSDYTDAVPEDGEFKANDVAVIPLNREENWLKNKEKAFFLEEGMSLRGLGVMGFGFPKYTKLRPMVSARDPIGTNITYDTYDENDRCAEWKMDTKLNEDERHGLSGSVVALSEAKNVVLAAIFQNTYEEHKGKRFVGTDLQRIRELLAEHGVNIREADYAQQRQTSIQLGKINDKLKEMEKNNTERGTLGKELDPDVKDLMKNVLNEVLDLNLKETEECSGIDCVDTKAKCAVRIVASISEKNKFGIASIRNAFVQERLHERYPRLRVLTLQSKASVSQISQKRGFTIQKDDVWNATRLFEEIWNLDRKKIAEISQYLEQNKGGANQKKDRMELILDTVPDSSIFFMSKSREEDLNKLVALVDDAEKWKQIYVSGVGGIGKTELAIEAVHRSKSMQEEIKPVYFLRYETQTTEDTEQDINGLKKAIMKAGSKNRSNKNLTPDEEYEERLESLRKQYSNAILIVDDFNSPGKELKDLFKEPAYKDLINTDIRVIFTTRCAIKGYRGITIGSISKEELVEMMRCHCPATAVTDADFETLIELVDRHTLAAELMAKTLASGAGRVTVKDIQELLTDGSARVRRFPDVDCRRNGGNQRKKLHQHLRDLFPLEALSKEEKMILSCAMLVPRAGMKIAEFEDILINNDPELKKQQEDDQVRIMGNRINNLFAKGWIIENAEEWKLRMEPVIAIVCRRVLPFDQTLCEGFLNGIGKYLDTLHIASMDRYMFSECFEQAAAWGSKCEKASEWKEMATQIRSEPAGWKQEVRR